LGEFAWCKKPLLIEIHNILHLGKRTSGSHNI
jgi:hypothetical protein